MYNSVQITLALTGRVMEWEQIGKVVILLFIVAGMVAIFTLVGTGKLQSNNDINNEIGYVAGFSLLIVIPIFFANELLNKSAQLNRLYVEWGMIYLTLIMAYVSMGTIKLTQLGGSIGNATATGDLDTSGGAGGAAPCCGSCCP